MSREVGEGGGPTSQPQARSRLLNCCEILLESTRKRDRPSGPGPHWQSKDHKARTPGKRKTDWGKSPTRSYRRWWKAKGTYEVKYREMYEPYIIAARDTLPRFDERFRQRER